MKKSVLLTIACVLAVSLTQAQHAHCGFDEHLEKMLAEDPSGMQTILEHNARTEEIKRARLNGEAERGGGPRIIPTVFHVIHNGGSENISYEQIEDQIRSLNEDYRRLNADTVNTRTEFLDVAADANVEFRLAKLDPNGDCTDGVVRIMSPLTDNASDDSGVKGLSYWPSSDYFNVWVVRTIDSEGEQGIVLGYAQFPGFGAAATDGVVVRADRIGTIGTAALTGDKGRVLTHEAGHWLGLFHTFQGGCSGGFFGEPIDDTPPQSEATQSNCPQNANTCSNDNPDLPDMVENYMDYSNGACQNTYTLGQKDAMDAVLSSSRSNIWSAGNLNDTGVLLGETPCAPKAFFFAQDQVVCAGEELTLTDNSYNGTVTTYSWDMPGATPSTSSAQNPDVVYNAPGVYSITLNVSNAQGSDSYSRTDYITVIPSTAQETSWFSFEGFEEAQEDYLVISDGFGNSWEETNTSYTGSRGIYIKNNSGNPVGSVDEFQLPSIDMTGINDPDLYFRLSYKQKSGASDRLRVYVSDDCGQSWNLRYNKSGTSLATVSGTTNSSFTPSSEADWDLIEVGLSAFASEEHLLVKFQCTSDAGNNIYIDDIQISGPLGVGNEALDFSFAVSPNPMLDRATILLSVENNDRYRVAVNDVTGKLVTKLVNGELSAGKHQYELDGTELNAGIYFVSVETASGRSVKKLVVQ
ncbi:MAG: PKD domain-containing protein [Flavobacteriales bacterium]|nr:PKD domain-containing protein [Flavobacteriales bacterium]